MTVLSSVRCKVSLMFSNKEVAYGATTSCKNVVETVRRKNNLSSFKSLLVTAGL